MKPRLLPRLGHCPSLGRSRGFFYFLSNILQDPSLGRLILPSYQLEPRGGVLHSSRPTYLIASFLLIKFTATSFFLVIRRSFLFFLNFFWIFLSFLNPRNYTHPNSLRLRFFLLIFEKTFLPNVMEDLINQNLQKESPLLPFHLVEHTHPHPPPQKSPLPHSC